MPNYINKNYIIWILISTFILAGIIFIIGISFIRVGTSVSEKNKITRTLINPPEIIKAVYLTSSSGGSTKKIDWLIDLAHKSELNAAIIDIKDFSGFISYDSNVELANKYSLGRDDIEDVDLLLKRLHENNIYVIARLTVFEDSVLAKVRPDWAVRNKYTSGIWYNHSGLAWINPLASESWSYFASIAKDASDRGFDEINFDYIRFPSDGDMTALVFPGWLDRRSFSEGGDGTKADIIGRFFLYLRRSLPDVRLSADMFGFVTTHKDDLGIGQLMENAFATFDFVAPMVYPSHYPPNYMKFENPAEHPYEVVNFSMKGGIERLRTYKLEHPENKTQFRPWLQDFNLGADYTSAMVQAQIKATQDALGDDYRGFMLWNARNVYHEEVFK